MQFAWHALSKDIDPKRLGDVRICRPFGRLKDEGLLEDAVDGVHAEWHNGAHELKLALELRGYSEAR